MTNTEIALSVILLVAAIIIWIQKLQINALTEELISSDDQSEKVDQLHEALEKSNYLMSMSGNSTFEKQVHENRKILSN